MSLWSVLLVVALIVGAILITIARVARPLAQQTPALSQLSACCPVCSGKTIYRTSKTYECANCHSALKMAFTLRSLWAIPVLFGACAVMLLTVPLHRAGLLSGVWLAGVVGGLSALGFSLTMRTYMRGFVYRPANPQNVRGAI
jgi:hypothetical protein